jgi:hypothetical protein
MKTTIATRREERVDDIERQSIPGAGWTSIAPRIDRRGEGS